MIWGVSFGIVYVFIFIYLVKDYFCTIGRTKAHREKLNKWKADVKEKEKNFKNTKFETQEEYLYAKWDLEGLKQSRPIFPKDEEFPLFFAFVGVVVCFVVLLFFAYIGNILSGDAIFSHGKDVVTEEYTSSWTITAMQDNIETNGRIYLTGGYINSDLYYRYFYPTKDGGFKAGKIPASRTTIRYSDGNYRIEKHDYKWNEKSENWIKLFCIYDADSFSYNDYYYVVYVPEGSIAQDFTFDLQ